MNWLFTLLMLATLLTSSALLRADEEREKKSRPIDGKGEKKSVDSNKDREPRRTNGWGRAEWERRREEFRKMTPEQREAKRAELKERLEKRIADLSAKEAKGKLSPQEKRELERRSQILKRFEQAEDSGFVPKGKGREPAAPAPPEK
jgi:hypothetical protein